MPTGRADVGLSVRIRALRPHLGGAAARVADRILADPAAVAAMTINELALAADASPATVTRVCRRLSLSGYPELRIGLAAGSGREVGAWHADLGADIGVDDPLQRMIAVIAARDAAAIRDTVDQLDIAALETASTLLARARRIDIYGVGGSATVASELQQRLHRIDRASWVWPDVHGALTSATLLGPQDVAFAISHRGETVETYQPLAVAAEHGAATIALTNHPDSTLGRIAEVILTTAVRPVSLRPDALAVRHSQLLVLDGLYVGVAQRTYDRTVAALEATAQVVDEYRRDQAVVHRKRARRRTSSLSLETEGTPDESPDRLPSGGAAVRHRPAAGRTVHPD